ncbi:MAG: uroporphyrinogen-III C-methyltransferase [Methylobacillus sp.]|jgi:uroporphyrin-3 C-methyltransferase|nr:uroporphyrinogen-III C-methyltransferase [Methylobacillus sp.]
MSEEKQISEAKPVAETPPEKVAPSNLVAQSAIILSVLALLAVGWQWWDAREKSRALEQTLTQRLSRFSERNSESNVLSKKADEAATLLTARVTLLEQQLETSKAQQETLQTMYTELASNRDEWAIGEAEHLVIIANQQLLLAGNVKPALLALQAADARLQTLTKPQVAALRKVIGQDIQRLQDLPDINLVEKSFELEKLASVIDKLPLASEHRPAPEVAPQPDFSASPWRRLAHEVWQDIKNLVRIERIDTPELPLLKPEQADFLRENFKLRLLSARIALLQHDEAAYRAALLTAINWLTEYFDTQDAAGREALTTLKTLSSDQISITLPNVSASLDAIANYKQGMERAQP